MWDEQITSNGTNTELLQESVYISTIFGIITQYGFSTVYPQPWFKFSRNSWIALRLKSGGAPEACASEHVSLLVVFRATLKALCVPE